MSLNLYGGIFEWKNKQTIKLLTPKEQSNRKKYMLLDKDWGQYG